MRSRQFVCNDPRVIALLERFVPVVDNPANYNQAQPERLQYQLVSRITQQTEYGRISGAQGLYIVTPSGRLIAGVNSHSSAERTLTEMRKGLDAYARLSRADRLLPRAPDERTDRVTTSLADATPPRDGLNLRMVSRGLPIAGVDARDTRHPSFYKLDRLWYRKDEARAFLPAQLAVGAKASVTGAALDRLALMHLGVFIQPNLYWHRNEVQQATLTSEVTALQNGVATVRFEGSARMAANQQYNHRSFDCELLGWANYHLAQEKFTAFELLALGTHTMGAEETNVPGPRTAPLGVFFTLNGNNHNDGTPPHFFRLYGWTGTGRL